MKKQTFIKASKMIKKALELEKQIEEIQKPLTEESAVTLQTLVNAKLSYLGKVKELKMA